MASLWQIFLLDLDISYQQILIPGAIGFRKFRNGLHRTLKFVLLLLFFIQCDRATFFSKSKILQKYGANHFFSAIKCHFEDTYSETFISLRFICNLRALGANFVDLQHRSCRRAKIGPKIPQIRNSFHGQFRPSDAKLIIFHGSKSTKLYGKIMIFETGIVSFP